MYIVQATIDLFARHERERTWSYYNGYLYIYGRHFSRPCSCITLNGWCDPVIYRFYIVSVLLTCTDLQIHKINHHSYYIDVNTFFHQLHTFFAEGPPAGSSLKSFHRVQYGVTSVYILFFASHLHFTILYRPRHLDFQRSASKNYRIHIHTGMVVDHHSLSLSSQHPMKTTNSRI